MQNFERWFCYFMATTKNSLGDVILSKEKDLEYGLLEVEAINVLNGHHINEYINKYYRIEHHIPTEVIRAKDYEEEDRDDWF